MSFIELLLVIQGSSCVPFLEDSKKFDRTEASKLIQIFVWFCEKTVLLEFLEWGLYFWWRYQINTAPIFRWSVHLSLSVFPNIYLFCIYFHGVSNLIGFAPRIFFLSLLICNINMRICVLLFTLFVYIYLCTSIHKFLELKLTIAVASSCNFSATKTIEKVTLSKIQFSGQRIALQPCLNMVIYSR